MSGAVVVAGLSASAHAADGPSGGAEGCENDFVCVGVEVPGSGGDGQAGSGEPVSDGQGSGQGASRPECTYELYDPQPPAGSSAWGDHEPGDGGAIYEKICHVGGNPDNPDLVITPVWLAEPPDQPVIDPAVLAQQAVDKMLLRGPDIASPRTAGRYTVGVPMWMWVNQSATTYGPNSASASAGGITVTATAKVSKIVWSMGDGTSVTCNGPGTPYQASEGMAQSPTCGHVYSKTSAGGEDGKFPVSATSTWTIDWQGGGEAGQLVEIRQTNVQVAIGELQVVR
ncbi:ATP/GTP-binding protein [Streptomyces sp. NPDC052415]|uniref:ATP/GTP-binding protein n=1 Tax=Streptomyces sp. NPDC052415 TaxID=3365690 RepID=UPI0037D5FCA4